MDSNTPLIPRDRPVYTRDQLDAGSEVVWELLGDVGPRFLLDEALAKLYMLGSRFQPL